jgi:hypothetical protein
MYERTARARRRYVPLTVKITYVSVRFARRTFEPEPERDHIDAAHFRPDSHRVITRAAACVARNRASNYFSLLAGHAVVVGQASCQERGLV